MQSFFRFYCNWNSWLHCYLCTYMCKLDSVLFK